MDNTRHGGLYSAPTSLQLSAIGIPSLEPIPGSAAPTPSLHNLSRESTPEDVASPPRPDHASFDTETSVYLTPSEASHGPYIASRRSSLAGSYFPSNAQAGPSSPASASVYPSTVASGANTPSERIRPAPIAIPVATPDEPLFSAYPDGVASEAEIRHPPGSKGKGRAFKLSFRTPFTLGQPPRKKNGHDEPNFDPQSTSTAANLPTRPKPGRRRASTFSGSPPEMTPISDQRRNSLNTSRMPSGYTRSLRRLSRRKTSRSSAASDASGEQSADNAGEDAAPPLQSNWPDMLMEERRRMELRPDRLPFTYGQPASSVFTLQSDTTARPAVSPPISPRRSSLVDCTPPSGGDLNSLLGLTDGVTNQPIEYIIPSDLSIPHDPPPRRSSLSFGPAAIKTLIEPLYGKADSAELGSRRMSADMGSVLSSSLTGTDTSASAEFFSTSPSSREHPLSSATTSLSRSAKSKDASIQDHSSEMHGVADQETRMNAIRLQRSLEWEARQIRHRRKLEKRKLIILELVETEVGYVDDLTTLVHVYLPQLYALPNVSSHTAEHIARNAGELLEVHSKLVTSMVDVLKYEDVGFAPDLADDVAGKLERVSRKLALLFVENVTAFSAYSTYCAGSIAAASLVRHISARTDYDAFERRCQVISSSHVHQTLEDLLADTAQDGGSTSPTAGKPPTTPSNKSRLRFRDFLIMPIQRVCKYPLLLNQLLGAATTPSPVREREQPTFVVGEAEFDIGVDVERALGAMRGVAEDADEARRLKEVEVKTNTIIARLEPHPALPMRFLKSLGPCRLIGSLDVLHHHPIIAPLAPPVKVKYMAAFLFRGYLILAKVKKGAVYEAKHFLPLEVFELIDIAEGFLPHSIRLSLRDHNFDLAASCETEKEVWSSALCQARDESTVPPFELPASVSPFAARPRRMSVTMPSKVDMDTSGSTMTPSTSAVKRHNVAFSPDEVDFSDFMPAKETDELQDLTYSRAPAASPIKTHFGFTPDRLARATPSTIWFRRASASQRLIVDRGLIDVFSENCATARSKAQLQHTLFLPESANGRGEVRDRLSMRNSTMLRRRQSFLDSRPSSSDIAFSGAEIKGSVLPIRQSRSMGGRQRGHQRASSAKMSLNDSSTELDYKHVRYASMSGAPSMESADETATSDFGTLTRRQSKSILNGESTVGSMSRNESPAPSRRTSLTNLRAEWARNTDFSASTLASRLSLSRRQSSSMSLSNRAIPNRAKSMPVSPIRSPEKDLPPVPSLNHDMSVVQQPAPKLSTSLTRLKSGTRSSPGSPVKATQRTRLQHVGGAEGGMATGDVAMYLHGEGITNQAPAIERRNSGPWSTLRRSMSFIRDSNTPNDTRDTGVSSSNSSNSDHHPQLQSRLSFSRPSYSRRQSGNTDDGPVSDADTTNAESIDGDGYGSHSREDSYGTGAGTGAKDTLAEEEAKRPEAPKRRKSVKIFSQLSRLTPL